MRTKLIVINLLLWVVLALIAHWLIDLQYSSIALIFEGVLVGLWTAWLCDWAARQVDDAR